ncbi:MAG: SDR family oxidoreductase, partial [Gemmatimonadetes bacterium]|nr:SDR family oxidoreductase [Gemmatimonadota bacterium]
ADLGAAGEPELPASDVVIHGAWVTSDPAMLGIHPAEYVAQNLRSLAAILEYAGRTRPHAFVFLSSSGVFSAHDGAGELNDGIQPTGTSPYAAAKRAAELLLPSALPPPTAVHVVRLGYLFGPGERARASRATVSLVGRLLEAARNGRPLVVPSDNPRRDWTFSQDLAPALDRLLTEAPRDHPAHLCSPHVRRDREWADLIASSVPDADLVPAAVPARPAKAPMVASDLPALGGFEWTTPEAGLELLLEAEAISS